MERLRVLLLSLGSAAACASPMGIESADDKYNYVGVGNNDLSDFDELMVYENYNLNVVPVDSEGNQYWGVQGWHVMHLSADRQEGRAVSTVLAMASGTDFVDWRNDRRSRLNAYSHSVLVPWGGPRNPAVDQIRLAHEQTRAHFDGAASLRIHVDDKAVGGDTKFAFILGRHARREFELHRGWTPIQHPTEGCASSESVCAFTEITLHPDGSYAAKVLIHATNESVEVSGQDGGLNPGDVDQLRVLAFPYSASGVYGIHADWDDISDDGSVYNPVVYAHVVTD